MQALHGSQQGQDCLSRNLEANKLSMSQVTATLPVLDHGSSTLSLEVLEAEKTPAVPTKQSKN